MSFKSILLVDDNEADNYLSRRVIERFTECRVLNVVSNGQEALDFLAAINPVTLEGAPDLILLDINMPLIDGWQFLELFERFPEPMRRHSMIAILTGSHSSLDVERAQRKHAVADYCVKPLRRDSVGDVLSSLYQKYQDVPCSYPATRNTH